MVLAVGEVHHPASGSVGRDDALQGFLAIVGDWRVLESVPEVDNLGNSVEIIFPTPWTVADKVPERDTLREPNDATSVRRNHPGDRVDFTLLRQLAILIGLPAEPHQGSLDNFHGLLKRYCSDFRRTWSAIDAERRIKAEFRKNDFSIRFANRNWYVNDPINSRNVFKELRTN